MPAIGAAPPNVLTPTPNTIPHTRSKVAGMGVGANTTLMRGTLATKLASSGTPWIISTLLLCYPNQLSLAEALLLLLLLFPNATRYNTLTLQPTFPAESATQSPTAHTNTQGACMHMDLPTTHYTHKHTQKCGPCTQC